MTAIAADLPAQTGIGSRKGCHALNAQLNQEIGRDISCNLGSINVAQTMASPGFGATVETAVRA